MVTRDDSEWPEAVFRATVQTLRERTMAVDSSTRIVAIWLEGARINIVYARKGIDIYYGLNWDTCRGITGTDWPEPEAIGFEIALYGVLEPHGTAHPPAEPSTAIHWIGRRQPGDVNDVRHIPNHAQWEQLS